MVNSYLIILCLLIAIGIFGLSILVIKGYINIAHKFKILDLPNNRSSHNIIIPRGAGIIIALFGQTIVIILYYLQQLSLSITLGFTGAFCLSLLGFVDDLINISVINRLIMQTIISLIASYLIIPFELNTSINLIIYVLASLFLVWSTNLFNFMDGIDGFAASEAIFVLCIGGLVIYLVTGNYGFSGCLWLISSVVAGFLKLNWSPAKVFMGDAGSYFLGFLIGISTLISYFIFAVAWEFWFIIYAAFSFDATVTLMYRIIKQQKWYQPHRTHAYQRLQDLGWQHKEIVYGLLIINMLLAIIGSFAYYQNALLVGGMAALLLLTMLYLAIQLKFNDISDMCI